MAHELNRQQRRERASMAAVLALAEQVNGLARRIPNENSIREMIEKVMADERFRLESLVSQSVRLLNVLVEKGIITQDERNDATRHD